MLQAELLFSLLEDSEGNDTAAESSVNEKALSWTMAMFLKEMLLPSRIQFSKYLPIHSKDTVEDSSSKVHLVFVGFNFHLRFLVQTEINHDSRCHANELETAKVARIDQ